MNDVDAAREEALGTEQRDWDAQCGSYTVGWLDCLKVLRRRLDHQPMDPRNQTTMMRHAFDHPTEPATTDQQLNLGGGKG